MTKRTAERSKGPDLMHPWRVWTDLWAMHTETTIASAEVIARRTLMMMTGSMSADEAIRMVTEKPAAFARGMEAGALALASGMPPEHAMLDAAAPVAHKARSNAQRLRG